MAKFIAIMLSTTNNLFLNTPVWSIFCNKKHHNTIIIPIWSLKGHHIWASFLPTTKPPLVLSASAAKRGKVCMQSIIIIKKNLLFMNVSQIIQLLLKTCV